METPIVDVDFLYNLAANDPLYVYEVIKLYLDTMPQGLDKLEQSIRKQGDYDVIQKQAHFLKSSASVVKVKGMYDNLIEIEILARQRTGKDEMVELLDRILANFKEALPVITAERDKCKREKNKAKKK